MSTKSTGDQGKSQQFVTVVIHEEMHIEVHLTSDVDAVCKSRDACFSERISSYLPNILLIELVVVSNSCLQQQDNGRKFIDLYTRFRAERWWSANMSESDNFEADEYI